VSTAASSAWTPVCTSRSRAAPNPTSTTCPGWSGRSTGRETRTSGPVAIRISSTDSAPAPCKCATPPVELEALLDQAAITLGLAEQIGPDTPLVLAAATEPATAPAVIDGKAGA
jgi:hypothetical protein